MFSPETESAHVALPTLNSLNENPDDEDAAVPAKIAATENTHLNISLSNLHAALYSCGALGKLLDGVSLRLSSPLPAHRQLAQVLTDTFSKITDTFSKITNTCSLSKLKKL